MTEKIPARVASHYCVFPLEEREGALVVAAPEELSREEKADLRIILGAEPRYVTMPRGEIQGLIAREYGVGAGVIDTLVSEAGVEEIDDGEVIDQLKDQTIVTLVNELFLDALKCGASDIHVEPFQSALRIRYRVDGMLQEARVSEKVRVLASNLISRIKIMAKLDIGEKRLPQDGRIKIRWRAGDSLDLRVSVLPSSHGEAIVVRILKTLERLELGELGFDAVGVGRIRKLLKKPHGVILVTGPTGSGKTTTLYSCLRELNQVHRKIITVEDPVEYKLPGVLQLQVNSKIEFTFARALRSILRHDPDCIMVGEIRDAETAEIAIRSALTGHLVFSTLHTNDAPGAILRLLEMGVEPFLVASAVEGVIAQRLVRKRCGDGYSGRIAVSEMMVMDDAIRGLTLRRGAGAELRRAALEGGMVGLYEDGLLKIKNNLTTIEELERVIQP